MLARAGMQHDLLRTLARGIVNRIS
jgi:hypothetical protein